MTPGVRLALAFLDVLMLNVSIVLSLSGADSTWLGGESNNWYLLIFSNLAWLFLVLVSTPYNVTKDWTVSRIVKGQLAFLFVHLMLVGALVLLFDQPYSPWQLAIMYLIFVPAFFVCRLTVFYLRKVTTPDIPMRNFMILGRNELSHSVRKYFLMNPQSGYKFKGYLDFEDSIISVAEVQEFSLRNDIQEIYCCLPQLSKAQLSQLVEFGLNSLIKVKLITASLPDQQQNLVLDKFDQLPGTDTSVVPLDVSLNQLIKRAFDLGISIAFNLLVMTWLVPIVGMMIKLDSKGPVFFVQLRSGRSNQPFKCLKFRTMVVNADSDSRQATSQDTRVTRLGNILRKTSIDELPQIINVLIGNMSLVGPRPHMLKHTEQYSTLIGEFMARHYVKPGITGLAQCLGYRGETKELADMENRVRLDRYYIENWSFWLDIKIIFLTVVSLIRGSDKAY